MNSVIEGLMSIIMLYSSWELAHVCCMMTKFIFHIASAGNIIREYIICDMFLNGMV